jgi:hypothetical protein
MQRLGRFAPRDLHGCLEIAIATRWLAKWLTAQRLSPDGALAGFMLLGIYAGMTGISRDRRARIIESATVLPIC